MINAIEVIEAPATLRPFVRRFVYANRKLDAPLAIRLKPTGYLYLSNHFGAVGANGLLRDFLIVDGEHIPLSSRWHLAGQITDHDVVMQCVEDFGIIYAELSATAAHRLFGISAACLGGRAPALAELGPGLEALAQTIFVAGPDAPRDRHVEDACSFFTALAGDAGPGDPLVEAAVAMLEAANGNVRIGEIANALGTSIRQLDRRFGYIVGMSPKFFGQILQMNWVLSMLYFNQNATLTEIAHEAGFYDQAHFNHVMQRFFSEGPQKFLKSEHLFFKELLGQSRRLRL